MLSNGSYIIDLSGTDDHGNQQDSEILVTVAGDYKPGRLVVDVPEFTVPVAGIPISSGGATTASSATKSATSATAGR